MRISIEYVRSLESRLEELRNAADQADEAYRDEIARLRLTDEEWEAIEAAVKIHDAYKNEMDWFSSGAAATLRNLLQRL